MFTFSNTHPYDRMVRLFLSVALFLLGYFWVGGVMMIVLLVLSTIMFITGVSGYCPLYSIFRLGAKWKGKKVSKMVWIISMVLLLVFLGAGSYASIFFTKKFFLEDYNGMNNFYKQTLFNTGKDKREESIANYTSLVSEYTTFEKKYSSYQPYSLRGDSALVADFGKISGMIANEKDAVYTGNLPESHLAFEKIRPMFQDILKRNNFSLLAISLVDFHDVMEGVIAAADAKDAPGVLTAYALADEKLKAVEQEANDSEIQAIRKSLEEVKSLAESGNLDALSPKAAELKNNFVKVYLKRG